MTETTRAILLRADLAVCPCQPTTLDTDSTEQTLQLIKQARSLRDGKPYALLVLSKAQRNTKAKKDALHWIKQSGFYWITSCIHQKQIFTRLHDKGLTIWDFENSVSAANQASAEYEIVFNSILKWGIMPKRDLNNYEQNEQDFVFQNSDSPWKGLEPEEREPKVRLNVDIDEDLNDRLDEKARKLKRSKSELMRVLLDRTLDE